MTTNTAQDIAARCIEAWDETDANRRRALVAALWTEDATYQDPLMHGQGHDGIDALIGGVQAKFPQFRFTLSPRPAESSGSCLRFSWDLGPDHSEAIVQGTDFVILAADGRLRAVTGFLDRVPNQS